MYQSYMCSFVMWIYLKAIKFHGIFFLSFLRESCGYFGFGSRNRMQSFQMLAHQHSNGVNVRIILSFKILLNWKIFKKKNSRYVWRKTRQIQNIIRTFVEVSINISCLTLLAGMCSTINALWLIRWILFLSCRFKRMLFHSFENRFFEASLFF